MRGKEEENQVLKAPNQLKERKAMSLRHRERGTFPQPCRPNVLLHSLKEEREKEGNLGSAAYFSPTLPSRRVHTAVARERAGGVFHSTQNSRKFEIGTKEEADRERYEPLMET